MIVNNSNNMNEKDNNESDVKIPSGVVQMSYISFDFKSASINDSKLNFNCIDVVFFLFFFCFGILLFFFLIVVQGWSNGIAALITTSYNDHNGSITCPNSLDLSSPYQYTGNSACDGATTDSTVSMGNDNSGQHDRGYRGNENHSGYSRLRKYLGDSRFFDGLRLLRTIYFSDNCVDNHTQSWVEDK